MKKSRHTSRLHVRRLTVRRLCAPTLKGIAGGDIYFEPDTTGDDGYGHTCNCGTGYCEFR